MADQELINKLQTLAEEGIGEGDQTIELSLNELVDILVKGIEAMSKTSRPLISPQQHLAIKEALRI